MDEKIFKFKIRSLSRPKSNDVSIAIQTPQHS
jgi:hypothetical protein